MTPPLVVATPKLLRPRNSLLLTAQILGRLDGALEPAAADRDNADGNVDRFGAGVRYDVPPCAGFAVYDPCDEPTIDAATNPTTGDYDPFVVRGAHECTTLDKGRSGDALDLQAVVALHICQHEQVNYEFWTGDEARAAGNGNDYLANPAVEVLNGGVATPVRDALAWLEDELSDCACGQRGAIHADPYTVALWCSTRQVHRDGGLMLTCQDTVVITGPGYNGSEPSTGYDDPVPSDHDTAWAYGTDMPAARLGTIGSYDGVAYADNLRTVWAERLAAAYWNDCCHVGINIDLSDRT